MPKTDPTARLKNLLAFDLGYAVIKCKRVEWQEVENLIAERDAQRDRAVLEQAAERVCKGCITGRPTLGLLSCKYSCKTYIEILSPIADKEGA